MPELEFSGPQDFHFPSWIQSRWQENNQVHGRLFRAGTDWNAKPSVIFLHGWNAEQQYRWQFPRLARHLVRAGVNVALIELPYHGHRRPRQADAIQNFISYDLLHMLEAARQSVADTQALLTWLRAQGSPSVGLWGVSLGAWLSGLCVSAPVVLSPDYYHVRDNNQVPSAKREAPGLDVAGTFSGPPMPVPGELATPDGQGGLWKPAFAVLLTPVARMDQAIGSLPFCRSIRECLQSAPVGLEPLNLGNRSPSIPARNILIIESCYDLFAPVETIEDLWRAWGEPQIWRLPHGHISVLLSPRVLRRAVGWVAQMAYVTARS